jgi:hypothetical protein
LWDLEATLSLPNPTSPPRLEHIACRVDMQPREINQMTVQLVDVLSNGRDPLPQRFERKYYLAPMKVSLAYGLLRHVCLMDGEYPSEQINSLYFDTSDLDQHERSLSGDYRKDKVRIRWYGEDRNLHGMQNIFIELKSRRGFASTKQRCQLQLPAEDLSLDTLRNGIVPKTLLVEILAGFGYFPPGLLQPIIKISYWRYRFNDVLTSQRVSLDCHIRSTMIMPGPGNGEKELELPGAVIEIKGSSIEVPKTFRKMRILDIDWGRFSKYSVCIDSHTEDLGSVGYLAPSGRNIRL